MAAWVTFAKERFPLSTYALLISGFVVSGAILGGFDWKVKSLFLDALAFLFFFAELRLMDELKDYQKDKVAHPGRPLPRGLIKLDCAKDGITFFMLEMVTFSAVIRLSASNTAAFLYLGIVAYLWLMYKEFYTGERLNQFPLVYAFSHQLILFPLCLFTVAIHDPTLLGHTEVLGYALTVFGAFFAYEVCRKLDPKAHPILKTYRSIYGPFGTALIVFSLLGIAAYGAHVLDAKFLWAVEGSVVLGMLLVILKPSLFKLVEGLAGLSLAAHIWAAPLRLLVEKFIPS